MNTDVATRENGAVAKVSNPFAGAPVVAQPSSAGIAAVNARELAEIHGQMQIARMNPRDPVRAMDVILNAFARPGLAETGMYEYARGGQQIAGLSIRAAEALAQCWGNIRTGVKELSRSNGQSEVQAYAWDLETGFYSERTFHVRHWRDTKQGGYQVKEERDIYEIVANSGARRQRACILAVIPGDVKEAAEQQIHTTMRTKIEVTPESIQAMVKYFADEFDVTKDMIEKRIQRRVEAILPAQMLQLKRIVQSLKDGMGTVSDFFEPPPKDASDAANQGGGSNQSQTQNVKEKLKGQQQRTTPDAQYDEARALAELDKQKTPETVQAVFDLIAKDYDVTGRPLPVSIEGKKNDRIEALKQKK